MSLSGVVLAGGKSTRMGGEDKAFLRLGNRAFVSIITSELLKTCNRVFIAVGSKPTHEFELLFSADQRVEVLNDSLNIRSPLGGLITAFQKCETEYIAAVGCDTPFLQSTVLDYLFKKVASGEGHDAAVPIWRDTGIVEPLCAVYKSRTALAAALKAASEDKRGCRDMIANLGNVLFVPVDELRGVDPDLRSLLNLNTREEYLALASPSQ